MGREMMRDEDGDSTDVGGGNGEEYERIKLI